MLDQRLIYSEERKTWNLFVNNEWYYEGDFETCSEMMMNNAVDDNDDYYGDDGDDIDESDYDLYDEVVDHVYYYLIDCLDDAYADGNPAYWVHDAVEKYTMELLDSYDLPLDLTRQVMTQVNDRLKES